MSRIYKFVEVSNVTDEEIERVVNEWTARGWDFESIHFAMREASRRPSMAFVSFTRNDANDSNEAEGSSSGS